MEPPLKYFLPAYLTAYFFAVFFWRSFVVWKRTGVNPLVFSGSGNAHDYIGRVFKLIGGSSFRWAGAENQQPILTTPTTSDKIITLTP